MPADPIKAPGEKSPLVFKIPASRPDLETIEILAARVALRPVRMIDAESIFEEFTPEITKYMFPRSPTVIAETESFIRESTESRRAGTELTLVITSRATCEFLGCCGLHGMSDPYEPEVGIWIKKSAHGQRLGREAVAALCDWAFEHLVVTGIVYPVDRENLASRKIAESLQGVVFAEAPRQTMNGVLDAVFYRILPGDREMG
jgi:ribosomal-protein-alanine N-acetyltransferase